MLINEHKINYKKVVFQNGSEMCKLEKNVTVIMVFG